MNSEILDRIPPSDLAAEQGVIGSLLLKPSLCVEVAALLKPEDFYADANQKLYRAVLALYDERRAVDIVLLTGRLKEAGEFEAIGGNAYLAEVAQSVPVAAHCMHYAGIVREKSKRRGIIDSCWQAVRDAYDDSTDAETLLDQTEAKLGAIGSGDESTEPITAAEATIQAMDRIDKIRERGGQAGLLTGIPPIDEHLGGLFPGEFNILAARPSMGKTSLALQIADYVARRGVQVYYVSLEMAAPVLMTRLLCLHAQVSSQVLRANCAKLGTHEQGALVRASQPYSTARLLIHDRRTTVRAIRRQARRIHAKDGLVLLVVDYLQLVTVEDKRAARHEAVGQQSRDLKALAVELDIPVLCLCQLNRESTKTGGSFPRISQLRESGSLEQDADVGLVLREPTAQECKNHSINDEPEEGWRATDPRVVVLDVQKNRNGEQMPIILDWTPAWTRFDGRGERPPLPEEEFADLSDKGWIAS